MLRLKPAASAYWAMNPKAIQCLAQLKCLKELVSTCPLQFRSFHRPLHSALRSCVFAQVLAFSPSSTNRAETVTLEQFVIFPKLELLSIMLTPFRGWEPGWHVALSPALEGASLALSLPTACRMASGTAGSIDYPHGPAGLQQLHSLTLGGVTRLHITTTLVRLVKRLRHLDVEVKEDLLAVRPPLQQQSAEGLHWALRVTGLYLPALSCFALIKCSLPPHCITPAHCFQVLIPLAWFVNLPCWSSSVL